MTHDLAVATIAELGRVADFFSLPAGDQRRLREARWTLASEERRRVITARHPVQIEPLPAPVAVPLENKG